MKKSKRPKTNILGLYDRDLLHHIILACILTGGFFGILFLPNRPTAQFMIGASTSVLYMGWGVAHHYLDGDLHIKSVIEYVLLGILGILVLWVLYL